MKAERSQSSSLGFSLLALKVAALPPWCRADEHQGSNKEAVDDLMEQLAEREAERDEELRLVQEGSEL